MACMHVGTRVIVTGWAGVGTGFLVLAHMWCYTEKATKAWHIQVSAIKMNNPQLTTGACMFETCALA